MRIWAIPVLVALAGQANSAIITAEEFLAEASTFYTSELLPLVAEDPEITEAERSALSAGLDINAFIQAVLRESFLVQSELLEDYASKAARWNELKDRVRNTLEEAREARPGWTGSQEQAYFEVVPYLLYMSSTSANGNNTTTVVAAGLDSEAAGTVNAFLSRAGIDSYSFGVTRVPAPASLALLVIGLAGLGVEMRRRQHQKRS